MISLGCVGGGETMGQLVLVVVGLFKEASNERPFWRLSSYDLVRSQKIKLN